MTVADEVKKMTEEAREIQRAEEAAKKATQVEANRRQCEAVRQHVNAKFPEVLAEIKEAAKNGKNYHFINIYQWKRLLTEAGFSFKDRYDTMEPCGSDSLFYHTVYSYYIEVQW